MFEPIHKTCRKSHSPSLFLLPRGSKYLGSSMVLESPWVFGLAWDLQEKIGGDRWSLSVYLEGNYRQDMQILKPLAFVW